MHLLLYFGWMWQPPLLREHSSILLDSRTCETEKMSGQPKSTQISEAGAGRLPDGFYFTLRHTPPSPMWILSLKIGMKIMCTACTLLIMQCFSIDRWVNVGYETLNWSAVVTNHDEELIFLLILNCYVGNSDQRGDFGRIPALVSL